MSGSISVTKAFLNSVDISKREKEIISEICLGNKLIPKEITHRSFYWTTDKVGAIIFSALDKNKNKVAVKIQGDKPFISEGYILKRFNEENRSKVIRPPKFINYRLWDIKKGYEVIIMEQFEGLKPVGYGRLNSDQSIKKFFDLYYEYKNNCVPKNPWFNKDSNLSVFTQRYNGWWQVREKEPKYARHPLTSLIAYSNAKKVFDKLSAFWNSKSAEFVHGHFSGGEIIKIKGGFGLTGNLFWGFKPKYYDLVFAYHWHSIMLYSSKCTVKDYQKEVKVWKDKMESSIDQKNKDIFYSSWLERTTAAFILDLLIIEKEMIDRPLSQAILLNRAFEFNDLARYFNIKVRINI